MNGGTKALLLAVLLLAAPGAQAALNDEHDFTAEAPVVSSRDPSRITVASGQFEAALPNMTGAFLVHDGALDIAGLDQVCWEDGPLQDCTETVPGAFSVHLLPGGTGVARFPEAAPAHLQAPHAIAGFADMSGIERDNEHPFNTSLAAVTHRGELRIGPVPSIPHQEFGMGDDPREVVDALGALAPVGARSAVEVRDGQVVLHRLEGNSEGGVAFTGSPVVAPVHAALYVLPVQPGDAWSATPARGDAALEGVGIPHAIGMLAGLEAIADGQEPAAPPEDPLAGNAGALAEFLAGVFVDAPVVDGGLDLQEAVIARYSRLDATLIDAGSARYEGRSALELDSASIVGAQDLAGPGWFKLPVWGWLLWAGAIGLAIAVAVRKPEKTNERWDPYRWVGLVAAPLALVLVFWLWDLEMRAVWGTSMLTTATTGSGFWALAGVQVGLLAAVLGLLAVPIGMILRHGLRLAGQGSFMGLATPAATVLAFLLGAPLLLSYLELLLAGVLAG